MIQLKQLEFRLSGLVTRQTQLIALVDRTPKQGGQDSYHEEREEHEGVLRVPPLGGGGVDVSRC